MPNHIHWILEKRKVSDISISRSVKQYKGYVTKEIGEPIWQRSYYDHMIRDEKDYLRIWKYIDENVIKWDKDKYY